MLLRCHVAAALILVVIGTQLSAQVEQHAPAQKSDGVQVEPFFFFYATMRVYGRICDEEDPVCLAYIYQRSYTPEKAEEKARDYLNNVFIPTHCNNCDVTPPCDISYVITVSVIPHAEGEEWCNTFADCRCRCRCKLRGHRHRRSGPLLRFRGRRACRGR